MTIKSIQTVSAAAAAVSLFVLSSASFAAAPLAETYPDAYTGAAPAATVRVAPVVAQAAAPIVGQQVRTSLPEAGPDFAGTVARSTQQVATGKTRAEVIAELRQAQADGSFLVQGETEVIPTTVVASTGRSRSDVRAEAIQSAQAGAPLRGN